MPDDTHGADEARDDWALDREIVITRVLSAPRALVFEAWTRPEHLTRWFSPKGFGCETLAIDLRVGGLWRFVFTGPDGRRYDNRVEFRRIEAPALIEFDHGSDRDDDPHRFRVTVTFDEQANGKTVLTLRQLHPTKGQRDGAIGFGAVEIGLTTLDSLADHLAGMQS